MAEAVNILKWLFKRRTPRSEPAHLTTIQDCGKAVVRELQRQMEVELFGHPTSTDLNASAVGNLNYEDMVADIALWRDLFGQSNQPDLPGIETPLDEFIRGVEFAALAKGFNLRERARAILPESLKPEGWQNCLHQAIRFAPDQATENNIYFFTAPEIDLSQWIDIGLSLAPQLKPSVIDTV